MIPRYQTILMIVLLVAFADPRHVDAFMRELITRVGPQLLGKPVRM